MYIGLPRIEFTLSRLIRLLAIPVRRLLIIGATILTSAHLHSHLLTTLMVHIAVDASHPSSTRDRVMHRVVALATHHLRQIASTRINKPIADLQYGQTGLLRQNVLLHFGRVRVEAVLVQPGFQDFHGVLGEVAASLDGARYCLEMVHDRGLVLRPRALIRLVVLVLWTARRLITLVAYRCTF